MTSWWYLENDESIGPLDVHEIEQLLQQRRISSTTMLKREGTETWRALREIPELEALTGAAQASAPAPPASHPVATNLMVTRPS